MIFFLNIIINNFNLTSLLLRTEAYKCYKKCKKIMHHIILLYIKKGI